MGLVLTEDQELIRKTARALVQQHLPLAQLRRLRDDNDATGFSRDSWRELAAGGLVGMALPEACGGGGLGLAELCLVMEECGRTLAATPFVSTVLLSARALLLGGSEEQRAEHLPAVSAGERILAFAHDEGSRFDPYRVRARAVPAGGGFRLSGEKSFVLDGHAADALIVVARTGGAEADRDGLTLFLVPRRNAGVSVTRLSVVDSRGAARVVLDGVTVPRSAVVGEVGRGADVLEPVLEWATTGLAAEMLGGTLEAFDRTVAYLKVRQQFGVPIGSFQALKHRAAWMFSEIELSKSIVLEAPRALDGKRAGASLAVSAAKARLGEVFANVSAEAIQMHGGIGMTDELDIGFFYKRARVAELTFGTAAWHRDRFARLSGF